jgi:murein L,D-transpeptidase YcbB/YkuD
MRIYQSITLVFVLALLPCLLPGQVSTASIRNALSPASIPAVSSKYLSDARQFYEMNLYRQRWLTSGGTQLQELKDLMEKLPGAGLAAADYLGRFPSELTREADSARAEVQFTMAALGIVHDLFYGKPTVPVSYDGLKTSMVSDSTALLLNHCLRDGRLSSLIEDLSPKWIPYQSISQYLNKLVAASAQKNFKDILLAPVRGIIDSSLLRMRLDQLAVSDTALQNISDRIRSAQTIFNIAPDGHTGAVTLQALNVPLSQRIRYLSATLNTLRWMYRSIPAGTAITVNIPSANLYHFEGWEVDFESRIIPGKPSTPTPTLSSFVDEVVLYPYWHVPYSIATGELLPLIKKNPGFIHAGNYQLLDSKGRIVSPSSVNWASITPKNFPYVLRQSAGCDNTLGWIKLNFDNPFSVYLHDTPGKILFGLKRRFFSHGCMRVEKAAELARKVLPGNTAVLDSLEKLGPLKNVSPISVKLSSAVPVVVLYQPAWFDSNGNTRFYEDIYRTQQTGGR